MKFRFAHCALLAAVCVSLAGLGCVSSSKGSSGVNGVPNGERKPKPATGAAISLDRACPLGEFARRISERFGGGIVTMNGIEGRPVPPFKLKGADLSTTAHKLAELTECAILDCGGYFFLYDARPEYKALAQVSLEDRLDPKYSQVRASVAFGVGLPLYAACEWIGRATQTTVIADNLMSETRCGEIALPEVSLQAVLEAVLRSARVVAFDIESTSEYIFIRSQANKTGPDVLLNADALTPEQNALLGRTVSVFLPAPPADPGTILPSEGAKPLGDVVDSLSKQLGVPVQAEDGLSAFPVNCASMTDVKVRTALNLLVRQWPIAEFGYIVQNGQIVITRRPTP